MGVNLLRNPAQITFFNNYIVYHTRFALKRSKAEKIEDGARKIEQKTAQRGGGRPHPSALWADTFPKGEGLGALHEVFVDLCTDTTKTMIDIIVCKADYCNAETVKVACSGSIMFNTFWGIMLSTVNLDNQFCAAAVEIDDISIKLLLASKLIRMVSKKIMPQSVFLLC